MENPTKARLLAKAMGIYWRSIVLVVWPMICALVFIGGTTKAIMCTFTVAVMAGYWITEVIPLGITSLIPVVAWPLMGITTTEQVTQVYFKETNMMFVAGLILAFAIENCGLHKRIALNMVLCIGCTHRKKPRPSRTTICYFLGITYSATIGGIGTLVGTGTNLTMKGIFEGKYTARGGPSITFPAWMFAMTPMMLVSNAVVWLLLNMQFLGLWRKGGMDEKLREIAEGDPEAKKKTAVVTRGVVKEKLQEMGPIQYSEIMVLILFVLAIILWIFRHPDFIKGWDQLKAFDDVKMGDSTPGMLICLLIFIVPFTCICIYCLSDDPEKRPKKAGVGLLTWETIATKLPWGLVLLLGGGFAVELGATQSGMSKMIGKGLKFMDALHPTIVMAFSCLIATSMTELSSNVAIANILLPVLSEMAVVIKVNPIYLMIPATVCCSYAFLTPVGTPGNAVASGYVSMTTKDMIVGGQGAFWSTLVICVAIFASWGNFIYDSNNYPPSFPEWAETPK